MFIETCYQCKIQFGMPDSFHDTMLRLREKGSFYCPAGHSQCYVTGESEVDKMRRRAERAEQEKARIEDEKREAEERARKAEAATKRLKKRAAAGVCACCNRTFSNMSRHMQTEHPEMVAKNVVKLRKKA